MDTRHPDSPLARINLEEPIPGGADPRVYSLRQAYATVMAEVEIEKSIKEGMFPEYAAAYASGDNKRCMDVCIYFLLGSGWTWGEFDRWFEYFKSLNRWPHTWRESFPRLLEKDEFSRLPKSYEETLPEVHVTELKAILKRKGINPKPAPKTREEMEALVRNHLPFEMFLPLAQKHIDAAREKRQAWVEKDKCRLLSHTIWIATENLGQYYRLRRDRKNPGNLSIVSDGSCAMEMEFARRFDSGEIRSLPPWFPGDQSRVKI